MEKTTSFTPAASQNPNSSESEKKRSAQVPILLSSIFIIAVCGILYELLISSISTYFLGSSILHFSITIGLFLSAMGLGSFLSRYVYRNLLDWFVIIETILGLVGGFSTLILYFSYTVLDNYYAVALIIIVFLGAFVGLEIPIVTRLLKKHDNLKDTISNVLAFDYLGSLVASVAFPILLLPYLGLMRTAFFIGIINLSIAIFNAWIFRKELKNAAANLAFSVISMAFLLVGFIYSFQISDFFEQMMYQDEVIYSDQTPYQRIVVTKYKKNTQLFINGNLQFSTLDEYRYHETLVHIPALLTGHLENVLILGGGDGLAVRELLKYDEIESIDVVDLDKAITNLAKHNRIFREVNQNSLASPKVNIYNVDAFKFVEESQKQYSLIIIDLPDPHEASLGKLYSVEFYRLAKKILAQDGVLITQSTSPYFAPKPFWCIQKTMQEAFPSALPINVYVPAFGMWGFSMGINNPKFNQNDSTSIGLPSQKQLEEIYKELTRKMEKRKLDLKYLAPNILPKLFVFDKDMFYDIDFEEKGEGDSVKVNRLDNQILIQYYENSWKRWE